MFAASSSSLVSSQKRRRQDARLRQHTKLVHSNQSINLNLLKMGSQHSVNNDEQQQMRQSIKILGEDSDDGKSHEVEGSSSRREL